MHARRSVKTGSTCAPASTQAYFTVSRKAPDATRGPNAPIGRHDLRDLQQCGGEDEHGHDKVALSSLDVCIVHVVADRARVALLGLHHRRALAALLNLLRDLLRVFSLLSASYPSFSTASSFFSSSLSLLPNSVTGRKVAVGGHKVWVRALRGDAPSSMV